VFLIDKKTNNRYFIINYGFALEENKYDGFAVRIYINEQTTRVVILEEGKTQKYLLEAVEEQLKVQG